MRLQHGGKIPGHSMHSRGAGQDIYRHLVWSKWILLRFVANDLQIWRLVWFWQMPKISIAGRKPEMNNRSTSNIEYIGIHTSEDYLTKRKNLEQIIENYRPQDFPCPYNPSTGTVDCLGNCISRIIDEYRECPEETLYKSQRELVQLDTWKPPSWTRVIIKSNPSNSQWLLTNFYSSLQVSFVLYNVQVRNILIRQILSPLYHNGFNPVTSYAIAYLVFASTSKSS